jgi:hypothetical protein
MQYALLIYTQPGSVNGMSDSEREAMSAEYFGIAQESGMLGGEQLQPIETATTVRVQNGQPLVTDGPFADTKEVFAGFYLLQADSIDTALEIAGRVPAARMGGAVEVRPIVERQS